MSAENAALYVPDGDIAGYARTIVRLLDDPPLRTAMGEIARARIDGTLGWPHQRQAYVQVYDRLVGRPVDDEPRVITLPDAGHSLPDPVPGPRDA